MKQFLVLAEGENPEDVRIQICDTLEDAYYEVDAFKEGGYDFVEIKKANIAEDNDDLIGTYEEIQDRFKKYQTYDEFMDNLEDDERKWIKRYGVMDYIEEHYDVFSNLLHVSSGTSYIRIPVNSENYDKLESKAKENGLSIESYVQHLINEAIGGSDNE